MADKVKNAPTVRRMPIYLQKLLLLAAEGRDRVSTTELAESLNLDLIVVRKDISLTGLSGYRRVGYNIGELIESIRKYVGWEKPLRAAVIGATPAGYFAALSPDISLSGVKICSIYDEDRERAKMLFGENGSSFVFHSVSDMKSNLQLEKPDMILLCVPGEKAKEIAERAVNSGVKYIWNFTGETLNLPPEVTVQRENIAGSLATLTAKMKLG